MKPTVVRGSGHNLPPEPAYGYFKGLASKAAFAGVPRVVMAERDRWGDPDRISFTRSLHAARRSVRTQRGTAPLQLARALLSAIGEICAELLPRRRLRAAARVVKRKMSSYGVRRAAHRAWPHPHLPVAEAIRILWSP